MRKVIGATFGIAAGLIAAAFGLIMALWAGAIVVLNLPLHFVLRAFGLRGFVRHGTTGKDGFKAATNSVTFHVPGWLGVLETVLIILVVAL